MEAREGSVGRAHVITLRRKFAILVSGLAVGVLVAQATAIWSIVILEREIAWPLRSIESVLRDLHTTKHRAEELAAALGQSRWGEPDPPTEPNGAEAASSIALLRSSLDAIDGPDSYVLRTGIASARTLRRQAEHAILISNEAISDPALAPQAARELAVVHELVERIESHILGDAESQAAHTDAIRRSVLGVTGVCLVALALTVFLGFLLFTRWVMRPVDSLRTAAKRISAGDFEHRIPVRGEDELAQLSREVNMMAGTINTMTQERVERERLAAIGEMVRRVAHNLRNPLAGIRSLAEVTHAELDESSDLREVQSRIINTVDRFERWLRDLLRSTTPLQIEPVHLELTSWLPEVIAALRPMADGRRIALAVQVPTHPVRVSADPSHLEQALVAIVTNALEVVPIRGRVDVRLTQDDDGQARIDVLDNGPGVDLQDAERIFQPYVTTKPDGTGIGLALARHVIQQHRGNIVVLARFEPGGGSQSQETGSCFRIRIPALAE